MRTVFLASSTIEEIHMSRSQSIKFITALGALAAAFAAGYADARSTTGFSAFHVEGPINSSENPYQCLVENNGAVVNNCSYPVSLEFDLPIDNTGSHNIPIQDYWGTVSVFDSFTCEAYAYAGNQGSSTVGTSATFYEPAQPNVNINVNVSNNGMSIQVICWNVPPGEGISNINWSA
jgi:hypothetical protein